MDRANTVPLAAIVGRNIRAIRTERGDSQDSFARGLRLAGLNWSRSTLAKLERGERGVGIEHLTIIAIVLGVPATRLLDGEPDEWVALTEEAAIARTRLVAMFASDWREPSTAELDMPGLREAGNIVRDVTSRIVQRWPELQARDLFAAEREAAGEAEINAAAVLDCDPMEVALTARATWGRSLIEERDRRVDEHPDIDGADSAGKLQAIRGHVTRDLLRELRQGIADRTADQEENS